MKWMKPNALALTLLLSGSLLAALPAIAQHKPTVAEQYLLSMANQERTRRGIQPLAWDEHLAAAAAQHAQRMMQQNNVSHQFPGEPDLTSRAVTAGARFSLVAENVAIAGSPQQLHTAWMNSPGHRANLLEPHENAAGIAVVQRNGELYAVEDFSEQVANIGISAQEQQVANLLHNLGMADVQSSADARKTCTLDTGHAGTRRPYFIMRYTTSDLSLLPEELKSRLATDKRLHHAEVGACSLRTQNFSSFSIAVLLYP
jgi:hypothetical protein